MAERSKALVSGTTQAFSGMNLLVRKGVSSNLTGVNNADAGVVHGFQMGCDTMAEWSKALV
jgi:hypothetical protein